MKHSLPFTAALAAIVFCQTTNCAVAADPPPTSATVSKTVIDLWKLKKFDKIEKYVAALSKQFPKRMCTVLAGAFVDYIIHGDVDKAHQELEMVRDGIIAARIPISDKLGEMLTKRITILNHLDFGLELQGLTKADLKRNPEVEKTRAAYGSKLPEELELISLAPDVDLP